MPRLDPGIQRRQLCRHLRRYRSDVGLTQRQVADRLYWSASKVLRIEAGQSRISITDLHALLGLYDVSDAQQVAELVDMARLARIRPWAEYQDVLKPEFSEFLEYESSAVKIRQFELAWVPGLLQTEAYARRIMTSMAGPEETGAQIERKVEVRLKRRSMLLEEDGPECIFILDEAALRRSVGAGQSNDHAIMQGQLGHLIEMGESPRVSIRILPFSAGEHVGMSGSFVILEFEDYDDEPLLYMESLGSDLTTREDPSQTATFLDVFIKLEQMALAKEASRQLIASINDEFVRA